MSTKDTSASPGTHGKPSSNKAEPAAARDYVAVARGSDLVVIRVVGKGNMLNAPGLADFAEEQRLAGFRRFVFDFERCHGLDSTFMGVMVGIHAALASESGGHPKVESSSDSQRRRPALDEPAALKAAAGDDELVPMSPQDALKGLEEKFGGKPGAELKAEPEPRPTKLNGTEA